MSARVDGQPDAQVLANDSFAAAGALLVPPAAAVDVGDPWGNGPSLPSDHPMWARDSLSLSQRARLLLARVAPVVVRVVAFWEHRLKSIAVAGGTLSIDASGCYRFP